MYKKIHPFFLSPLVCLSLKKLWREYALFSLKWANRLQKLMVVCQEHKTASESSNKNSFPLASIDDIKLLFSSIVTYFSVMRTWLNEPAAGCIKTLPILHKTILPKSKGIESRRKNYFWKEEISDFVVNQNFYVYSNRSSIDYKCLYWKRYWDCYCLSREMRLQY